MESILWDYNKVKYRLSVLARKKKQSKICRLIKQQFHLFLRSLAFCFTEKSSSSSKFLRIRNVNACN